MMRRLVLLFVALVVGWSAVPAVAVARIMPPPNPGPGWVRVWVAPVYRTVYERVWIEERTQQIQERVWVPPSCEWRDIVTYDEWGHRIVRREYVELSPGYWSYQWRTIVVPAHEETVARQELVSSGYWKWVPVEVPPMPVPLPRPIIFGNPPTVGVEGYKSLPTEDLSKFSPLTEWPDKK